MKILASSIKTIAGKWPEILSACHGLEDVDFGQIHNSEVVGLGQLKPVPCTRRTFLLLRKSRTKLVIGYIETFCVYFGEHVKSRLGSDQRNPVN